MAKCFFPCLTACCKSVPTAKCPNTSVVLTFKILYESRICSKINSYHVYWKGFECILKSLGWVVFPVHENRQLHQLQFVSKLCEFFQDLQHFNILPSHSNFHRRVKYQILTMRGGPCPLIGWICVRIGPGGKWENLLASIFAFTGVSPYRSLLQ